MVPTFARAGILLALLNGSPALAFNNPLSGVQLANFNPLNRGPLVDFLNLFRGTGHTAPGRRLAPRLCAGHGRHLDERAPPLLCPREWRSDPVWRRRWPARLHLVRHENGNNETPMAGLDAAAGTSSAGPTCHAIWLAAWTIRLARARFISCSSSSDGAGSNEPDTIGAAVSSGCIRMTNQDVVDLSDRVRVGMKVVVIHEHGT